MRIKILRKIRSWWFNRQVKKYGVLVGENEKYKTIQEALDANEKYIIVKGGPTQRTVINKNNVHIVGLKND